MSKDTFYFSHDYNVRSDEKIKKLIIKHGFCGYGLFWAIIEDLYNNANALRTDYDCIAYDLRTDIDTIKSIINDFDLFVIKDGFFGSLSIEKRLNDRNEKSIKARESANKRWGKIKDYANALPTQCDSNAIKERKGKEIKVKEIKESKKNTTPSLNDIIFYFHENGYDDNVALRFFNYYDCAGWKDSKGEKVLNWKQKAQSVWFKEENKVQIEVKHVVR